MKDSLGRRWVMYVGRSARGRFWPVIWFAFAVFWGVIHFVRNGSCWDLFFSATWLWFALLFFERRQFCRIIQEQEEEIGILRSGQNNSV